MTRQQILALGPADRGDQTERAIDVRIARLRRKLEVEPDGAPLIRTVRGEGCLFSPSRPPGSSPGD